MHRFYLPPEKCESPEWTLSEEDAHHAAHVLRIRPGQSVAVLNGEGAEWRCDVLASGRGEVRLKPGSKTNHFPLKSRLILIQAVTKGKTMDLIIQKATELGAFRIVPLLSDRSVPDWDAEAAEDKVTKWNQIAIESIKQCGSPWLPKIERPLSVHAYLQRHDRFELSLVASLQPEARHPKTFFDATRLDRGRSPESVGLWVGPEGDFTPAEMSAIRSAGALPVTLGPLVLRSETAAIYCMSIAAYEAAAPA